MFEDEGHLVYSQVSDEEDMNDDDELDQGFYSVNMRLYSSVRSHLVTDSRFCCFSIAQ